MYSHTPFALRNIFNDYNYLFFYWEPHSQLRNAVNINLIVNFISFLMGSKAKLKYLSINHPSPDNCRVLPPLTLEWPGLLVLTGSPSQRLTGFARKHTC